MQPTMKRPKTKNQAEKKKQSDAAQHPSHQFSVQASSLLDGNDAIPKKLMGIIEQQASTKTTSVNKTLQQPTDASKESPSKSNHSSSLIPEKKASVISDHAKLVMERKQSALHCYLRACWMRLSRHHLQEKV